MRRTLLLAALLTCAASAPVRAQVVRKGLPGSSKDSATRRIVMGTIDGFVGDSALNPLQAAEVKILSTNVKVSTGPNGRFRISQIPAGSYVLIVRRIGYGPTSAVVQVAANDTLRPSYSLERVGTTLSAAVVTAERTSIRLKEFNDRRRVGLGQYMTADEIDQHHVLSATELMRRFSTVNVSPSNTNSSGGSPDQYALSRREGGSLFGAVGGQNGYCAMQVWVDNVRMPLPFNLDLLPSPRDLAGIEVYAGPATTPPQFQGFDATCGVILIWTKDGT